MQDRANAAPQPQSPAAPAPVTVTLPDGSRREFPGPVSGADIAAAIGPGLARAAIAVTIDGRQLSAGAGGRVSRKRGVSCLVRRAASV